VYYLKFGGGRTVLAIGEMKRNLVDGRAMATWQYIFQRRSEKAVPGAPWVREPRCCASDLGTSRMVSDHG